jgi:hypothetical protein
MVDLDVKYDQELDRFILVHTSYDTALSVLFKEVERTRVSETPTGRRFPEGIPEDELGRIVYG